MANDKLVALDNKLQTLDITKLAEYSRKIKDIGTISPAMAPLYIRDFILAYDLTNAMLYQANISDIEAKAILEMTESIAYLDRAGTYLESKGIKDSATARDKYVDIDDDVLKAKEIKAKTEALVSFLKNKLNEFKTTVDSVKKIAYHDNIDPYSG